MKTPSGEWTEKERLEVIGIIADRLGTGRLDRPEYDRIRFLAYMPARFLEANRDQILAGIQFQEK
jgi:hypothetical protein